MSVIKRQSILSTMYSYLGVAVGVITQGYVIPTYFTTQENGLLAILLGWSTILGQIGNLGFSNAGTKFFNSFRDNNKYHNGFLNLGLRFQLVGFLLVIIFWIIAKSKIIAEHPEDIALFNRYYYYLLPMVFMSMLFSMFDHYAKNMYDTVWGTFLLQFFQRFLQLIACLFFAVQWVDFPTFMLIWVGGLSLPMILMLFRITQLPGFSFFYFDKANFQKIKPLFVRFALYSVLTGLSSTIITQLDKIMLNEYIGLSKVGIYNLALLFSSVMGMAYIAVNKASAAIIIDKLEENNWIGVQSIFKKSSITLYITGWVVLVCTWANIDDLFSFLKPEYSLGKTALIIIGFSKLYDLLHGVNGLILGNSKYYRLDSFLVISFVVVLYWLNHILIPIYQLNGAALAALAAVFYYNTTRTFLIYYYFKIQPFGKEQVIITFWAIVVLCISFYLPITSYKLLTIIYKSAIISIIFLGGVLYFNVSEEANSFLYKLLRRKS